jgi:hypothetical protein
MPKWKSTNSLDIKSYTLNEILNFPKEQLENEVFSLYIDYETLTNNFDIFMDVLKLMMKNNLNTINCENFDCVKFINNHITEKMDIVVNVLDDFENRLRAEINANQIDKIKFTIPISYLMWQIDFDNLMYVNMAQYQNNALTYNGNKFISLEDLKKIKEIIVDLKSQGNFTDLQIIILVANYLQKNTEYVCENYFEDNKTIYKLDTYVPNIEDEVGLIETILLKKYGLCTGIANATTLLLNNTEFNIDARTIANHNHALNIVRLDNQYYFIDNTWGITRSPKEFEKAKKTLFFNSRFLLFGQNTFEYFHQPDITTFNPHFNAVPDKNFKQKEIIKAQNQMQNKVSFTYPEKIILPLTKTQK